MLQPHPTSEVALNLATGGFRDGAGADEHDGVERNFMLVYDRLADAADDLVDLEVAAMDAFHFLYQHDLFFGVFGQHREHSPAVPPQRRMAVVDRILDILRIVVDAAHDDDILDAAGDEQLSSFVHETEIASAEPEFILPLDPRLEGRSGCGRISPIAFADVRS